MHRSLASRSAAVLLAGFALAAPGARADERTPNATISTTDLAGFGQQPRKTQELIRKMLDLTRRDLTYKYGSADPAKGGMDCSGTMFYLLRQAGFTGVPRTAAGQYRWVWENGQFHAVISSTGDSFEFSRLRPGDLLFWTGTYDVDRDPPVTHSMLYLGRLKKDGRHVMAGASNGRSFEGKARNGVSVFDFKLPRRGSKSRFIGYGRLPAAK